MSVVWFRIMHYRLHLRAPQARAVEGRACKRRGRLLAHSERLSCGLCREISRVVRGDGGDLLRVAFDERVEVPSLSLSQLIRVDLPTWYVVRQSWPLALSWHACSFLRPAFVSFGVLLWIVWKLL